MLEAPRLTAWRAVWRAPRRSSAPYPGVARHVSVSEYHVTGGTGQIQALLSLPEFLAPSQAAAASHVDSVVLSCMWPCAEGEAGELAARTDAPVHNMKLGYFASTWAASSVLSVEPNTRVYMYKYKVRATYQTGVPLVPPHATQSPLSHIALCFTDWCSAVRCGGRSATAERS